MKVGIDLGTTNSALAWIDPAEAEDTSFPPIHIFDIPQLVAPNRIEPRRTLPSFLFLEEGQPVGTYAREQGAIVPTRLVHSAKSWLSNADVDRTAKILPWDAGEGGRVLSPVEVSARFLSAIREAWDKSGQRFGPLADQDVVLTVPASFDEEARELTVQAANDAGLPRLTLIEEPAAAFYSWIANNFTRSRKLLFDGQVVLVCDVGGGTSDFSLIRVSRDGDKIDFTRTAVGKHLLLGGDNLDLTLAWLAESKLGKQLSIRQRSGLRRQCSAAKEILLCDPKRRKRRDQRTRRRIVDHRRRAQNGNHARRSARTHARRFSADHPARRKAEGRKAQPVPRTRPALCFRPGDQPPSLGVPRIGEPGARRHPLQRRLLHSGDLPHARRRRSRKLVRQAAGDFRESRSRSGRRQRRGLLFIRPVHRLGRAGSRRTAARLLRRLRRFHSRVSRARAAPKKATASKWIAKICNSSPTSRSRFA